MTVAGPRTYEIAFDGQASRMVRAEFDDCQITVGPHATILRAELPDQCALAGLIQRIIDLRLEISRVLRVLPPDPDPPAGRFRALNDSQLSCAADCLASSRCPELVVDASEVGLGGMDRNAQLAGNLRGSEQ